MDEPRKLNYSSLVKSFNSTYEPFGVNYGTDQVDKLEIPSTKKYREIVQMCRFYYRKDPIASTVINKLVDIGITDLIIQQSNLSDNEFRVFTGISKTLKKFARICALEFLLSGLVIPEITYTPATRDQIKEFGIKKYESITIPSDLYLTQPENVVINSAFMSSNPSYFLEVPDDVIAFIQSKGRYPDGTEDKVAYDKLIALFPEFVILVANGQTMIPIINDSILRRNPLADSPYPTPYLNATLETLKLKRNLKRMDYSLASRMISAILLIKLGNDLFPVTETDTDQFEAIRNQMLQRSSVVQTNVWDMERIFQLYANHTVTMEWITPDISALLNEAKYNDVNADIFFSLGFPRILTTGETERSGSSNPEFASLSPVKSMEEIQDEIIIIINKIIKTVSNLNGFKSIPYAKFDEINLHAFADFINGLSTLYNTGNISREHYASAFGFDWKEEMNIKSEENKLMEELKVGEFAPQPFSPQPTTPGGQPEQTNKNSNKTVPNSKETTQNNTK